MEYRYYRSILTVLHRYTQQPPMKGFLKEKITLSLHDGVGSPYVMQVKTGALLKFIWTLLAAFLVLFLGSLLFFRELQTNSTLKDRLFGLEIHGTGNVPVSNNVETSIISSVPKIAEALAECTAETCEAKVTLTPSRAGQSQGELLILLETQVPRIGTGNPNTLEKHQFISYPGYVTHSELNLNTVDSLARKPFLFSKGLQTTATFGLGQWVRPIAMHVYLFDTGGSLITHTVKELNSHAD